nr:NADH dehydrogenase subunit 2 [Penenirmus auritus]
MNMFTLFICLNVFSIMLCLSSSSWFLMWVSIELSTFSFIPLMVSNDSKSKLISSWKYYVIQSVSSVVLMFCFLFPGSNETVSAGLVCALLVKMGMHPFSGWVIHVGGNLGWWGIYMLSTLQKAVPTVIVSKLWIYSTHFSISSVICCLLGFSFLVLMHSIQWAILYSSVFNISWMLAGSVSGSEEMVFYYMVYIYQLWVLFLTMKKGELTSTMRNSSVKVEAPALVLCFFFLMGIPPLGMFLPKINILSTLWGSELYLLFSSLTILTSFTFIMYLKLFVNKLISPTGEKLGSLNPWLSVSALMVIPLGFSLL